MRPRRGPRLERAGVYVLVGQSEVSPLPRVYVGEGDPVRPRLDQHAKLKDFWTHAVVFTSKDQNLNKAHVQRLEARLVELARASKRCVLDNNNVPQAPSLSEADTAEVEGFLADMLLCLPILGYGYFESTPTLAPKAVPLVLRAKGIEAHGFESPKGFVVGSGIPSRQGGQGGTFDACLSQGDSRRVDPAGCARRSRDRVRGGPGLHILFAVYGFGSPPR